jgi:hypothetical protein
MTNQFPGATKMVLSPAAQAVLTAATQKLYCLDPEDVPMSASEYGSAIAAALRAAAGYMFPNDTAQQCYDRILAIAAELEHQ